MIRKTVLALAAVAAIGAVGTFAATEASAKKGGGWHHHHHGHGHGFGWRRGFGIRFYTPSYQDCVRVITRRGKVKIVCTY